MMRGAKGQGLCPWTPPGGAPLDRQFLKEGKERGHNRRVATAHDAMPPLLAFLKVAGVWGVTPQRGSRGQSPLAFGTSA
jgi:hypothetical protein